MPGLYKEQPTNWKNKRDKPGKVGPLFLAVDVYYTPQHWNIHLCAWCGTTPTLFHITSECTLYNIEHHVMYNTEEQWDVTLSNSAFDDQLWQVQRAEMMAGASGILHVMRKSSFYLSLSRGTSSRCTHLKFQAFSNILRLWAPIHSHRWLYAFMAIPECNVYQIRLGIQ